jgi:hypothetical protein
MLESEVVMRVMYNKMERAKGVRLESLPEDPEALLRDALDILVCEKVDTNSRRRIVHRLELAIGALKNAKK